jgi:hypothetical protein
MKRVTILIPLTLLVLGLPAQEAAALEKPIVEVIFDLGDPHYRREFTEADITGIEQSVTELLVDQLSQRLDFLHFVVAEDESLLVAANADTTAGKRLAFELNRLNRNDPNWFQEVVIHIQLEVDGQPLNHGKVFWDFRGKESSDQIEATKEELVLALKLALANPNIKLLTADVLRHISIGKGGEVVPDDSLLACIIPVRPDDLCMDRKSVIVLEVMIPSSAFGSFSREFQANFLAPYNPSGSIQFPELQGMMVTEIRDNEHCDALRAAEQEALQVEGIYIQEYILKSLCRGALPPNEAFAAEGGSQ